MEDVNPLILILLHEDTITPDEAFEKCAEKVTRKLEEIYGMIDSVLEFRKEHPELVEEIPDDGKAESDSPEGPITNKQIRYIGYLYRKRNEEPNYDSIRKLTRAEASKEIARLESELGEKGSQEPKPNSRKSQKAKAKKE